MSVPTIEPWPEVEGPRSVPLSFGLFSAAQSVETFQSGIWESGVTWQVHDRCSNPGIWPSVCTPVAPSNTKITDGVENGGMARAFVVFDDYQCWAPTQVAEAGDKARRRLESSEQGAVETAVWSGVGGNIPALAKPTSTDLTPSTGAVSLTQGIGILEEQLGCLGGVEGVLHMSRRLVSPGMALFQFWRDGAILRTGLNNRVAAYSCSPNTGPDGQPAGANEQWIYATGPIKIWRSEISVPGGPSSWLDRSTNMLTAFAERVYLVMFDCPILAIRVDARAATAMSGTNAFAAVEPPADAVEVSLTSLSTANARIATLTVNNASAGQEIHYGDGASEAITTPPSQVFTHTYPAPGDYQVSIVENGTIVAKTRVTIPAIAGEWTYCLNGNWKFTATGVTGPVRVEMSDTYAREVIAADGAVTITYLANESGGTTKKTARVTVQTWGESASFTVDLSTLPQVVCTTVNSAPANLPNPIVPGGGGLNDTTSPQPGGTP